MAASNTLPASVQPKKGRLYAVIQTKENRKSKPVWRSLGLPEGSNKSKVNKAFREDCPGKSSAVRYSDL